MCGVHHCVCVGCPAAFAVAIVPLHILHHAAHRLNICYHNASPSPCLPTTSRLQSANNLVGQQTCKQCTTGTWTGRLTGQTKCWSTSQALPNQPAATRRR